MLGTLRNKKDTKMRKAITFVVATMLVLFANLVFAKDATFVACTADHKQVSLLLGISDETSPRVESDIDRAFKLAASKLYVEELQSSDGFDVFVSLLTPEDKEAITSVGEPPMVIGNCK